MSRVSKILVAVGVTLSAAFAGPALAADKVKMEQLPQPAQQTVKREVGKHKIEAISKTTKNNRVVYDIEWEEADGTNYEMRVRNDGKILKKDTSIF